MNTAVPPPADSQAFADIIARIALAASESPRYVPVEDAFPGIANPLSRDDPESATDLHLLSYESALRRPTSFPADPSPASPATLSTYLPIQATSPAPRSALARVDQEADRKRCIVSIRLSPEESELLRLRAAESAMSVSAYVRSCVLEADQLRTQVKQALSALTPSVSTPAQAPDPTLPASLSAAAALPIATPPARRIPSLSSWLRRVFALLLGRPITLPISAD